MHYRSLSYGKNTDNEGGLFINCMFNMIINIVIVFIVMYSKCNISCVCISLAVYKFFIFFLFHRFLCHFIYDFVCNFLSCFFYMLSLVFLL